MLARQVCPGRVQEFMSSYEKSKSRPHGYLMLDLKPTTGDQQRLKTYILPSEFGKFSQKQSYDQLYLFRMSCIMLRSECKRSWKHKKLPPWKEKASRIRNN